MEWTILYLNEEISHAFWFSGSALLYQTLGIPLCSPRAGGPWEHLQPLGLQEAQEAPTPLLSTMGPVALALNTSASQGPETTPGHPLVP